MAGTSPAMTGVEFQTAMNLAAQPVIASAAKQSIVPQNSKLDCFVAFAPVRKRIAFVAGNDGAR
jgi:hypothetical protein